MNQRIEQFLNDVVVLDAFTVTNKYADIIPYWDKIVGFNQNNPWHYASLDRHIIDAMDFAPKKLVVKLALLFHDHGKLFTQTTDNNGISHYYKHALLSAEIFLQFAIAYNLPVKLAQETLALIKHHTDYNIRPQKAVARLGDLALSLGEVMIADREAHNPISHAEQIDTQWFTAVDILLKTNTTSRIRCGRKTIVMIGAPKSGKSTYVSNLDGIVISRDATRIELGGRKDYFEQEQEVTKICAKQLDLAFKQNKQIVVDNTHLKKAYRDELRIQSHKHGYDVVFIEMETDYDTIFKRAKSDGFPLDVLFNMLLSYVPIQNCER